MSYFERRLNKTLSEMAQLVDFKPTSRQRYTISFGGEEIDIAYGNSPQDAIADYVNEISHIINKEAAEVGLSSEQYIKSLTAKLDKEASESNIGFTNRDIKSINSKKTRQTIENWLNANPTPYKWIISFEQSAQPTPGVITYVKTGNAGGDVLTPHMILHTLGHAVVGYDTGGLQRLLETIMADILGNKPTEEHVTITLSKLLHMRAAELTIKGKPRGFPTFEEAINEIVGIYVKNGRVKIAPNAYCDYQIDGARCKLIQDTLHAYCIEKLDEAVGKVIYDE